ncbi:hypothetical protein A5780_19350 [Nocardia sp. 852002-20019_SCH5090214]|jgi:Fe-S cluster assembly iron-binding protein IscA|uniref:Fe-S cluster assembly protein HesB n=3 Tax=Nocardia TaxID=1817 RepID=A0A2S6AEG2_9NOCA|nr:MULTISPECIES: hypothetical protein [Nocardia]OBF74756.1 hypothetical protein A9X06_26425 [Mycobacterium sp. 852002-51759_SCH5129042]MBF6245041.1 hypothetical protein [Nocardia elegans]MBF6272641.1 hypothetical protein [Nocardia nova]MBF6449945.1 hypothetical protein [Nocardia elegans]MBV7701323.1 hypothetical protein [Nocardia nova]
MLMLTPTAIEAVRTITSADGMPDDAGLRISSNDGAETLQLAVAAGPSEQDQVLNAEGPRVFLDEQVVDFLDDKILDTGLGPDGQGTFVLAQQDPNTAGR